MKIIIDLFEGIIAICVSIWCFFYYTGRLNYLGDKEKERAERVKKYGGRLIFFGAIIFIGGVVLLLIALKRFLQG